jgi:hypothetical protein
MFEIPVDQDAPEVTHSLLREYGRITKEQVHDDVERYINLENRAAQDDYQVYLCLMNSVTKEAKDKLLLLRSEYTFGGSSSGVAFLKIIIRESHVDTNATLRYIREQLSSFKNYMTSVDSDITKFNQHVHNLLDSLAARGATTEDLLSNLFKGYAVTSDKAFVAYLKKKEDDYDDGTIITPEQLMLLAENKYKAMVEGSKWKAPDEQAEKIIALEARVRKLDSVVAKGKTKPKTTPGKPGDKKKGKEMDGPQGTNRKPDWMVKKPEEGAPKKKVVNDKTYHWCPNHQCWTIHSPAECKGKKPGPSSKPKAGNKKTESAPSLKVAKALQAIAESDLEDDEE